MPRWRSSGFSRAMTAAAKHGGSSGVGVSAATAQCSNDVPQRDVGEAAVSTAAWADLQLGSGVADLMAGDADAGEELDGRGSGAAPAVTPAATRRRRQRRWCNGGVSSDEVTAPARLRRRRGERRDGVVEPIGGVTSTNFDDAME
ncbi:hypothetical protein Syun_014266 [Stephania yunnanensis]|uniref:Uncharacterized protein n=1 Tax=Stephania yunnanensis TaxID=152371 RepID=A0AAP0PBQ8_9MAGN